MMIERINIYDDDRFSSAVLFQHGAFLVDGERPCSFYIRDECSATVCFDDYSDVLPVIEEFRFYAEHISTFYDPEGNLIAKYPSVAVRTMGLNEIQPSQFFVDQDKVRAVSAFLSGWQDIIVPVVYDGNIQRYVSLDGHTRMYYAYTQGWERIKAFVTKTDPYIFDFVAEARNRGILGVKDIKMLCHAEYLQKWEQFCDDFWENRSAVQ